MLVVYDMIHDYCHLLKQKVHLIDQAVDCPEQLKEAVSSLLYAAPRCGEFPELQEIRAILSARFGKELVTSGVSQKMVQKLSSKELSLENRRKMLIGIARENGIILQLETEKVSEPAAAKVAVELGGSGSFNSGSPNSRLENGLNSEPVRPKGYMSESSSRYDSESDYDEIIEEDEEENMKMKEFDDLYSDDYSDDDDDDIRLKKEKTGLPSRTLYFSSYKQFPFRNQASPKAGLGRLSVEDALYATT